jgi:hypothetical protein
LKAGISVRVINDLPSQSLKLRRQVCGFDTLNFSTCQSRRSAIIRHIKINGLSEPYNGKMTRKGIVTALRAWDPSDVPIAKGMKKISYAGYRFPPEIIQQSPLDRVAVAKLAARDVHEIGATRYLLGMSASQAAPGSSSSRSRPVYCVLPCLAIPSAVAPRAIPKNSEGTFALDQASFECHEPVRDCPRHIGVQQGHGRQQMYWLKDELFVVLLTSAVLLMIAVVLMVSACGVEPL